MAPCSEHSAWAEVHLAWPWRPPAPASSSGWRTLAAIRFQNCSLYRVIHFVPRRSFRRASFNHLSPRAVTITRAAAHCMMQCRLIAASISSGNRSGAHADARFWDDRLVVGLIVFEVGADGARPIDLVVARTAVSRGPVQTADYRLPQ